jgi:hypothetical protein
MSEPEEDGSRKTKDRGICEPPEAVPEAEMSEVFSTVSSRQAIGGGCAAASAGEQRPNEMVALFSRVLVIIWATYQRA